MAFKPDTVNGLRRIIEPQRTEVDFAYVMNMWAKRVKEARKKRPEIRRPHRIENEKDILKSLIIVEARSGPPPEKKKQGKPRRKRVDVERYAATLLAEIFHKFTGRKPTRVSRFGFTDTLMRDKSSNFYRFADAAFRAIKLKPSEAAFREGVEEFNNPSTYSREMVHLALWGGIPRGPDEPPNLSWPERPLQSRRKRTFEK